MNPHVQNLLHNKIEMAILHGYKMSHAFCLAGHAGFYMPSDAENPSCHPLETIIVGQKITDAINYEVMYNLGVSAHWINGFIDYFNKPPNSVDMEYAVLPQKDSIRKQYMEGACDAIDIKGYIDDLEKKCAPEEECQMSYEQMSCEDNFEF